MKARKQRDRDREIKRKKKELQKDGQQYLGDDDDLLNEDNLNDREDVEDDGDGGDGGDAEDNTIPNPVAHQMFKKYMGYKSDSDMDHIPDCVVWRDWSIFLYMLGRGLLSDYKL